MPCPMLAAWIGGSPAFFCARLLPAANAKTSAKIRTRRFVGLIRVICTSQTGLFKERHGRPFRAESPSPTAMGDQPLAIAGGSPRAALLRTSVVVAPRFPPLPNPPGGLRLP